MGHRKTMPTRHLIAISRPVAMELRLVAGRAVLADGGQRQISQRVVGDILLQGMLDMLGENAADYVLNRLPSLEANGWAEKPSLTAVS
jgi:hypothetical protein